jgi:2-oxoisovalerate dehydrogenase E2 component (dihydrolipoyl transacylase)
MAIVGKPLVDIDIIGEIAEEAAAAVLPEEDQAAPATPSIKPMENNLEPGKPAGQESSETSSLHQTRQSSGKHATLATPAVRHIAKDMKVDITHIEGTGKEGRVTKEDIQSFITDRDSSTSNIARSLPAMAEETKPLSPVQAQMFKSMTKSLSIPHFLFTDEIVFDALSATRATINKPGILPKEAHTKISYMPFILKAVSLALQEYPLLNSKVDVSGPKPQLISRPQHNIGVAMDTPIGLLVPNIKGVQDLSIAEISNALLELQSLAMAGKLTSAHLTGGTFTVSNIGSIGGTVVAPLIVESEVSILGVGSIQELPRFDSDNVVVRSKIAAFSWSADHRVVDGATMARMAGVVKGFVEEPEKMLIKLR